MKTKVLVIDDSGLTRRSLRAILEAADCDVVEAEDGLTGFENYYLEKPDVVILDLVMRGMYGLQVLQKLRELDAQARIIVVSADIQTSSRELAEQAGAVAFVNKPFEKAEILAALETALSGAGQ